MLTMPQDGPRAVAAVRRGAGRDHWVPSEDSVEAELGGEYSEASLEAIRSLGKKNAAFGEVDTEELAASLPPSQAAVDAAKARLEELRRDAEALKNYEPTAAERERVLKKRALVEQLSADELAWVKLQAYHRGLEAVRTARGIAKPAQAASTAAPAAAAAGAGTGASGASGVSEGQEAGTSSSAFPARDAVLRAAMALIPSSSSEEEQDSSAYLTRATAAATAASSSSSRDGSSTLLHVRLPAGAASARGQQQQGQDRHVSEDELADGPVLYRADYVEEQRLTSRLARQRQQRSAAFALSFAVAGGLYLLKALRRKRGGANGQQAAKRPAPQVSVTLS